VPDRPIDRGGVWTGVFFIAAGVLFLLDRLEVIELRARYVLPALLIAVGVGVLISARRGERP
jgi:hypothetical protein